MVHRGMLSLEADLPLSPVYSITDHSRCFYVRINGHECYQRPGTSLDRAGHREELKAVKCSVRNLFN